MKNFSDLTEREVLAVAISAEEEDSRIYMTFAEDLAERYPESAKIFEEMAEEKKGHPHMLLEMYEKRFGSNLPPIRRENVRGFLRRRPIWLTKNLSLDAIRKEVGTMEFEPGRARGRGQDAPARVRPAICAAGPRRIDGRVGVNAGAAVRRRLCHASELADLPGGTCRLDRRRHQHGVC